MSEEEKEFKKNLDHLVDLMSDPKVGFKTFVGLGMMPVCNEEYVEEMQDTLGKCLEDEDFLNYVRKQLGVIKDE